MKKRFVFLGFAPCFVLAFAMVFSASALAYQEVSIGECTFQIPDDFHVWERKNSTASTMLSDSEDYINDDFDSISVFSINSGLHPYITTPESIIDQLINWKTDAEANGETDFKFICVGDCPALLSHKDEQAILRILNRYEWVIMTIISYDTEQLKNYEETLIPLVEARLTPVKE